MEIIGLGAALGMLIAAACVMCYRKGVRDGIAVGKGESPTRLAPGAPFGKGAKSPSRLSATAPFRQVGLKGSEDEAAMMMRRYEAILSYDPYNQKAAMSEGERV